MHTCTHAETLMTWHTRVYTHMHTRGNIDDVTYTYVYTHKHTYVYMYTHVYNSIHIYTHAHIHTYTHTHPHTHTHTQTQVASLTGAVSYDTPVAARLRSWYAPPSILCALMTWYTHLCIRWWWCDTPDTAVMVRAPIYLMRIDNMTYTCICVWWCDICVWWWCDICVWWCDIDMCVWWCDETRAGKCGRAAMDMCVDDDVTYVYDDVTLTCVYYDVTKPVQASAAGLLWTLSFRSVDVLL